MEGNRVLTKQDWAKYPFTPGAVEYVKTLDINIDELTKEFEPVLTRAEQRIENALRSHTIGKQSPKDDIELSSFPIAVMMAAATGDSLIKNRYALAEAKHVSELLTNESNEKLTALATIFGWNLRLLDSNAHEPAYDFALDFLDFLRNTTVLKGKRWKLVNRLLSKGAVYLTKHEVIRLLEEEVRRHIAKKLDTKVGAVPNNLKNRINGLRHLAKENRKEIQIDAVAVPVTIRAFPPCMKRVYDTIAAGRPSSHIGRFALTAFLLNIGMEVEKVITLFRAASDFDEKTTRYQVEHIAGVRGSRTKYVPPRCATLQTHGVCFAPDEVCKGIHDLLTYYKRRSKAVQTRGS